MDKKFQFGALIVVLILGSVLFVSIGNLAPQPQEQESILEKEGVSLHIATKEPDPVLKKEISVFCRKALADLGDQASFFFSDNVDKRTSYRLKIGSETHRDEDEVFINIVVLVIRRYDPNNIKDLVIPGKWEECVKRLDDVIVGVQSGYYRDHRGNLSNIIKEIIKVLNQDIKKSIKPLDG